MNMNVNETELGKLDYILEEEAAEEVRKNPYLDYQTLRAWIHEQLKHLAQEGLKEAPDSPPVEPPAAAELQDEMDALDALWVRALKRYREQRTA
jgi:hypothetical protein